MTDFYIIIQKGRKRAKVETKGKQHKCTTSQVYVKTKSDRGPRSIERDWLIHEHLFYDEPCLDGAIYTKMNQKHHPHREVHYPHQLHPHREVHYPHHLDVQQKRKAGQHAWTLQPFLF